MGSFDPWRKRSGRDTAMVVTANQHVDQRLAGRPRRKAPASQEGRARGADQRGVGGPGKARKTSCPGGATNGVARLQGECNLRGKRSDP